ncbi:MAG: L-rhamnose isomerase [Firmicutes bacterium]|nr:L-rhamnose isomerase [Bacillota bacterium]
MAMGAARDYFCEQMNVPVGMKWLYAAKKYEQKVRVNQ